MTRDEIIEYALSLPGAVADQPFPEDFESVVLRHRGTGKWFGLLLSAPARSIGREGDLPVPLLNLKCDPETSFTMREIFPWVIPAYHMSKVHWISVVLDQNPPDDLLCELINKSYDLTVKKKKK